VLRPGSQDEVLLVDPATSKLELRRIAFSVAPDGTLLVRSGLGAGEQVVLDPIPEAAAGDVVQVESEAAAAPFDERKPTVPAESAKAGAP
jgi:hypothetical protein